MNYSLKYSGVRQFLFKFLQSRLLLYCVVLLLVLKIGAVLILINISPNIFFADVTKSALESFVNQTRQSLGLHPLEKNQNLDQAAMLKAQNMVQNQYFSHVSPTGISPWFWFTKAGYSYKYAGENLAIGFFESEEVFNAWLNSPSHRDNILNPNYTELGTAVLAGFGPNNSVVVVQEFASPLPQKILNTASEDLPAVQENIEPVAKPEDERVLSQSIELQNSLESVKTPASYVLHDYSNLLEKITYALSLLVMSALILLTFFRFSWRKHVKIATLPKEFVFRIVILVVLLIAANLANKQIITLLIPHQIII